jgi:hypothetical protein
MKKLFIVSVLCAASFVGGVASAQADVLLVLRTASIQVTQTITTLVNLTMASGTIGTADLQTSINLLNVVSQELTQAEQILGQIPPTPCDPSSRNCR